MTNYEYVCYGCGNAITKYEVGSYIEGQFVDFVEREVGTIHVFFCIECTKKMQEIASGGIEKAIERRETSINYDEINEQETITYGSLNKEKGD